MTDAARRMIREFLPTNPTEADIERAAKFMRDVLRIGGIKICRSFIAEALKETR